MYLPVHLTTVVHGHFFRVAQIEHVLKNFDDKFNFFKICPSSISVQAKTFSLRLLKNNIHIYFQQNVTYNLSVKACIYAYYKSLNWNIFVEFIDYKIFCILCNV